MSTSKPEGSARDRLLGAATELFYKEGIHSVGIDRVIEHAGVAKASLYSTFGSKEELVRAYLAGRAEARERRIAARLAEHERPRDRVLAIFDLLAEQAAKPGYRGCAFINACAEGARPETRTGEVCLGSRAWLRGLFAELAREAGAADPEGLARKLALIYDGATVAAGVDRDQAAVAEARGLAAALIDAQLAPPAEVAKPRSAARASRRR